MKIIGVLSFYDESPAWLAAVCTGFARVCDEIVAVDGAYMLYPGARPRSHPEQAEAIIHTCEAAGVGCTVHRPRDIFYGNEVEKRNLTLQLAGAFATPGEDWLMVFDGDYMVMRCEPDIVRQKLEQTDLYVASYTLLDGMDPLQDERLAAMAPNMNFMSEWTARTRDIYRWTPDLRYGPAHFTIRGTYDGAIRWIRGPELVKSGCPVEECLDLNSALVAVHRTKDRAKLRKDAAQDYYKAREAAGIEWLDGEDWAVKIAEAEDSALISEALAYASSNFEVHQPE